MPQVRPLERPDAPQLPGLKWQSYISQTEEDKYAPQTSEDGDVCVSGQIEMSFDEYRHLIWVEVEHQLIGSTRRISHAVLTGAVHVIRAANTR